MPFIPREEALKRLREQVAAGRPILGCGAAAEFASMGRSHVLKNVRTLSLVDCSA